MAGPVCPSCLGSAAPGLLECPAWLGGLWLFLKEKRGEGHRYAPGRRACKCAFECKDTCAKAKSGLFLLSCCCCCWMAFCQAPRQYHLPHASPASNPRVCTHSLANRMCLSPCTGALGCRGYSRGMVPATDLLRCCRESYGPVCGWLCVCDTQTDMMSSRRRRRRGSECAQRTVARCVCTVSILRQSLHTHTRTPTWHAVA